MKFSNLDNFTRGWIVGDFQPSLFSTKDNDIGILRINKGDKSDGHFHKNHIEYNIIIEGKVKIKNNILIAYEPVWSIGSGLIPKTKELFDTISFIKKKYKKLKVLYGGSVNPKNINELKLVNNIDGYLVGGASQNPKKFIDIIKKTYN